MNYDMLTAEAAKILLNNRKYRTKRANYVRNLRNDGLSNDVVKILHRMHGKVEKLTPQTLRHKAAGMLRMTRIGSQSLPSDVSHPGYADMVSCGQEKAPMKAKIFKRAASLLRE